MRYIIRSYIHPDAFGFGLLLFVTILGAFLYFSGTVDVGQHDTLYTGLLVAVWCFYFGSDRLLRIPMLGTMLRRVGSFLLLAGVTGFFGGIYWLIFTRG